jgi:hypothetical protein
MKQRDAKAICGTQIHGFVHAQPLARSADALVDALAVTTDLIVLRTVVRA